MPLVVPRDLILGVSTSSHQVEGGDSASDWWAFEREAGRIRRGDRADRSVEFWNRHREDVALMQAHGIEAHRMSVSWARIEPEEGKVDEAALDRYAAIVDEHRRAGIRVAITLLHFTIPRWLSSRGGILADDAARCFFAFCRRVAEKLRGSVFQWHMINEPLVLADGSYRRGVWPPGEASLHRFLLASRALFRLHVAGYRAVHEVDDAPVGPVHNMTAVRPRGGGALDAAGTRLSAWILVDSLVEAVATGRLLPPWGVGERLDGLRGSAEMIGVNYYAGASASLTALPLVREGEPGKRLTQMGWTAYPEGLGVVLRSAGALGVPVFVTENGIATDDDEWRARFLVAHLREVVRARAAGIRVGGYSHWSWIDNFEWSEGFEPRFGLVEVDPETLDRRPKPSLGLYAQIARERLLPDLGDA